MSFKVYNCIVHGMDDDPNYNLVELVELLQQIDENAEGTEEDAFVIYDEDGNKILL